jgi:hypothetical protein
VCRQHHNRSYSCIRSFCIVLAIVSAVLSYAFPGEALAALELVGTIQSPHFSGAVLSDGKSEQTFFRIGEKLPDGSKLISVNAEGMTLKGADGSSYIVYIHHTVANNNPTVQLDAAPSTPEVSSPSNPERSQRQRINKSRPNRDRSDDE